MEKPKSLPPYLDQGLPRVSKYPIKNDPELERLFDTIFELLYQYAHPKINTTISHYLWSESVSILSQIKRRIIKLVGRQIDEWEAENPSPMTYRQIIAQYDPELWEDVIRSVEDWKYSHFSVRPVHPETDSATSASDQSSG